VAEDTRSGAPPPLVSGADIRTFLFADMRGYTRFTQEHGDDAASTLAGRFADLVRETVPDYEGELLELRGDEALCVFRSARQALRASVELQRRLRTAPDGESAFPMGVGVGLDAGEAVPTHGGYRGASLNLAARLCAIAKPGQILASDGVLHLARRVEGLRLVERRPVRLKGIDNPVRLVEVVSDEPLPALPAVDAPGRNRLGVMIPVGVVAVLLLVGLVVWSLSRGSSPSHGGAAVIRVRANSVAVINPKTRLVVHDVDAALGKTPFPLVFGGGAVWSVDADTDVLVWIDAETVQSHSTGLGVMPQDIEASPGHVWLGNTNNTVTDVDPTSPQIHHSIGLHAFRKNGLAGVGFALGRLWIALYATAVAGVSPLIVIDPATDQPAISRAIRPGDFDDVAGSSASLWVLESVRPPTLFEVKPVHGTVRFGGTEANGAPAFLAVTPQGDAWVAWGNHAWEIGHDHQEIVQSVALGSGSASAITASNQGAWITTTDGTLWNVDPVGQLHRIHLGGNPTGVAVGAGRVWVAMR
jgi:class 3 adenylate cyclase